MSGPASELSSVFGTHGVVKVPLTYVKIIVYENKYHHRVQRETLCKEIYILLHFYLQINEPGQVEALCSVCG